MTPLHVLRRRTALLAACFAAGAASTCADAFAAAAPTARSAAPGATPSRIGRPEGRSARPRASRAPSGATHAAAAASREERRRRATGAGLAMTVISPTLYRDPARCELDCGELVQSYSTPAYVSRDVPRSLTLVYRSGRAKPMPVVEVDVSSSLTGTSRLGLKLVAAGGGVANLAHGAQEVVRHYASGAPNRLAAQLDGAGLEPSTVYAAVVTAYDGAGAVLGTTQQPVRVLIDVLNGPGSPYGAGWGVAGLQQLRWADQANYPSGGVVIVDGEGAIGFWAFAATSGGTTTFTSPPGDVTSLTYTGATGAFARRYPDGTVVAFNGWGSQTSVTDRLGNVTQYKYVNNSRLRSVTDPAGQQILLDYRGLDVPLYGWRDGTLADIYDGLGRAVYIGVDVANDLRDVNDADRGHALYNGYDGAHRLVQTQDKRGGLWSYGYDAAGQLATRTSPEVAAGGAARRLVTQLGSWAAAVLPAAGTGTAASPASPLSSAGVRATVADAQTGHQTRYALDRWGAPTRVEGPGGVVATATRDANGNVTRAVDARGQRVDLVWNAQRPWLLDSTYDAAAKVGTRFTYDAARGYALQRVVVNGAEQQYVWTRADGRVDSVRAGGAGQKATGYRYLRAWDARPDTVVDPRGHKTSYAYAAGGLQNAERVTAASGVTSVARDRFGRDSVVTDPLGRRTSVTYDLLNRPLTATDPAGKTTTTAYDALFPRTVTDALGQVYRDSVNALGQPVLGGDPRGAATAAAYDGAGRVQAVTNRRGQTVTFGYDPALGFLSSRTTPDGHHATYGTDALDRVRWARNAEGVDSVFTDSLGRDTLAVRRIAQVGDARYLVRSAYDALGRRAAVTVAREGPYEPGNTSIASGTTRYWYGAAGQLDSMSAHGATTRVWYNDDRAADSVRLENGAVARQRYTPAHALASRRYGPAAVDAALGHVFAYDSLGRVATRFNAAQSALRRYTYDPVGRLTSFQDGSVAPGGCAPADPSSTQIVNGDGTTNWQCTPGSVTYDFARETSYDAVGNPNTFTTEVETGNLLRRLLSTRFGYDADGNLTVRSQDDQGGRVGQRLSWNSLGQLTGVWNDAAAQTGFTDSVTFGYDAWGRRVRRTNVTTGVTTYFVWDGDDLIADVGASGRIGARYAYYPGAPDQPHSVAVARTGMPPRVFHYAVERPGHVKGLLAEDQSLAARYAYQPFGAADIVQENLGGWSNRLRFGAREYDRETGLYYQRARYYDPQLGRFVSQDPIGLAGGINPYAYAGNDPVNNSDPFGLECQASDGSGPRVTGRGSSSGVARLQGVTVCGGAGPSKPASPAPPSPGQPAGGGRGGGGGGGRQTPKAAPAQGRECQATVGASGSWGFMGLMNVGANLVVTSSGDVGFQLHESAALGVGAYAGYGVDLGVGRGTPLSRGTSYSLFGTVTAGLFESLGVTVARDMDGNWGVGGSPLYRVGAGFGAFVGVGGQATQTVGIVNVPALAKVGKLLERTAICR